MTEEQRWRWWMRSAGAVTVLVAAGMAVAGLTRSPVVLALTLGLLILLAVAAVAGRVRPGTLVPPPLQSLDTEQRRLVTEAVKSGEPAPDPVLAPPVAAMARRQQTAMALLILSAGIGLYLRIDSLASGSGSPAFDWVVIAFWLFVAAGAVRFLVRR